jgi:cyclopropane fatty-acyl-phospholipid synthase-like methyltransferase
VSTLDVGEKSYDIVVAYGLLHCLSDAHAVEEIVGKLQQTTRPGGLHLVCTFNDRSQDLSAHPGFQPFLASHSWYLARYATWEVLEASDADLTERHPHNDRLHTHSMTRVVARRRA